MVPGEINQLEYGYLRGTWSLLQIFILLQAVNNTKLSLTESLNIYSGLATDVISDTGN